MTKQESSPANKQESPPANKQKSKSRMLIAIHRQVMIAGQVIDKETSQPIARAEVKIESASSKFVSLLKIKKQQYGKRWETMSRRLDRVYTASDGSFYFVDLPAGKYTLTASLPGSGSRYGTDKKEKIEVPSAVSKPTVKMSKDSQEITVSKPNDGPAKTDTDNKNNNKTILDKNLKIILRLPPTTLKGKITNSEDKAAVMAKVRVQSSGEYAFTDAEGEYCLTGLEAGKCKVEVSYQGKRKSVDVSLEREKVQTKDIQI